MQLITTTSIFRCMPSILPLHFRRLLGAFAYAIDGAELAYCRLCEAALDYELPRRGTRSSPDRWTARNRLSILNDAWGLIDHVGRARKLVSRFPWDASKGTRELNQFVRDTKQATLLRNRLHQLDEDVYSRVDCVEGHSIVGTVRWVDARKPGGPVRFAVSSGSSDEAEQSIGSAAGETPESGDVGCFRLRVCEQEADLDALHATMLGFAARLESSVGNSVRDLVATEAKRRNVPVEELCESHFADLTVATGFQPKAGRRYMFEVPADAYHPGARKLSPGLADISHQDSA